MCLASPFTVKLFTPVECNQVNYYDHHHDFITFFNYVSVDATENVHHKLTSVSSGVINCGVFFATYYTIYSVNKYILNYLISVDKLFYCTFSRHFSSRHVCVCLPVSQCICVLFLYTIYSLLVVNCCASK